ncbi:MAG: hypothetical protein ABJP70_06755 [Erythrobacter sp.]
MTTSPFLLEPAFHVPSNKLSADASARIVFYLPVVTPWWFEHIVVPLIRIMARAHETHVLIPPLWHNTGLGEEQLHLIQDLDHVQWHLLDGPDHPLLREDASKEADLIEFVEAIAPDFVLCRSADIKTPTRFPGTVRYIMEGAAPPLVTAPNWAIVAPTLFDYGMMPALTGDEFARLQPLAQSLTPALSVSSVSSRNDWLALQGIEDGQTVIGLPLEYEHEENFFRQHQKFPSNAAMIETLCSALPDEAVLAVTNHPLNDLYGDNIAVHAAIVASDGKAILLDSSAIAGQATQELAHHCDGMIVGNSKSWAICAATGTPLLRLSDFATGDWSCAYTALSTFLADVVSGEAKACDLEKARQWLAYHLVNAVFDPTDPTLSAQEILDRMNHPYDPARWDAALVRYNAQSLEVAT